jgi:hypothetical protein
VAAHGLGDREQRFARCRRRRRRLADEADLVAEPFDPPGEPLRQNAVIFVSAFPASIPRRPATTSPTATAVASSSESMSGGSRVPARRR